MHTSAEKGTGEQSKVTATHTVWLASPNMEVLLRKREEADAAVETTPCQQVNAPGRALGTLEGGTAKLGDAA